MENEKKILIHVRAIILNDKKLLVVKHPHDTSFAALPGGHLEWGEDVRDCISREIVEELGVKPEIGKLLYINNFTQTDNKQHVEFFFEVKNGKDYLDAQKLTRSHGHEISEIIWASPIDDIRILPKSLGDDFRSGKIISNEVRFIDDKSINYQGVIIEESLNDKSILAKLKILKTKVSSVTEKHKTPWVKQWTMHTVEIDEKNGDKIAEQLSEYLDKEHAWYVDFKNENYHFIIYRGKIFKVDLKNPILYKEAKQYGISLGIPEYQVDFAPDDQIFEQTN